MPAALLSFEFTMSRSLARRSRRLQLGCVLTLSCLALAGCSAEERFEEEPIKAHLRQINKAYWTHLGYHDVPPKPENLRQDVEGLHALDMGAPADQALVSPRDKQPFVIVYGADKTTPADAILAYEKVGAEGTRWVVTMSQDIKEMPNDEFKKATFPKGHEPEAN